LAIRWGFVAAPLGARMSVFPARVNARLLTVRSLDGRSQAGRRARQIARELMAQFDAEITPIQKQACERAGMLTAIAEDLAARQLMGVTVDLDAVLRAEGAARRAVKAITAERPAPASASRERSLSALEWSEAK